MDCLVTTHRALTIVHAQEDNLMSTFRRKISTVALAASVALISGTAAAERGVTDTSIKIGNIGPFSGKAAMFNPLNYGSVAYMRYVNDLSLIHI